MHNSSSMDYAWIVLWIKHGLCKARWLVDPFICMHGSTVVMHGYRPFFPRVARAVSLIIDPVQ